MVNAQLDNKLGRKLWLVKWLPAIPHYMILASALAFSLLSIVAFFAILFIGRYPQSIFDLWRSAVPRSGSIRFRRCPSYFDLKKS